MFLERLLNQGELPLIEQTVRFSAAREKLIAEDVANISTPGYQQKDLSVEKFQKMLRERMDDRDESPPGSVEFDDITGEPSTSPRNILFHDGNNRSIEQLMSDGAKNALLHNTMIEILRKQISQIEMALKERSS
jgi:flagellar basal-body rod protein FlgB